MKTISIKLYIVFLIVSGTLIYNSVFCQVELVPATHPVYSFLKRMEALKIIKGFNSSDSPVSRKEIAGFLLSAKSSSGLTHTDKKILEDYLIEFEFDSYKTLKNSSSLLNKFDAESVFGVNRQKYLYGFADTNASIFLNVPISISGRGSLGDNGNNSVFLGEFGIGIRGTLFNRVGYSAEFNAGQRLHGNDASTRFAMETDPILKSNPKFLSGNNYYDYFTGHIRYQAPGNWLSLTLGRENVYSGFGYIDKLFLSGNTVPMDFFKIDLNYKKIRYTFSYGSIKGDSLGAELKSKNIAFHRLNVRFSDVFRAGFFESVVISNNPFSFVYFNPISFLTSADLNTGAKETLKNNTLMGLDVEINPVRNVSLQGTLLVDDINFSSLFKDDKNSNDNKFGYQAGSYWTNAFSIPDLSVIFEYTRLNPFVYSHRSNKDTYTNWSMSLGHSLPPNSDEIAVKMIYNITHRIKLNLLCQFRRSADGIYYDSVNKQLINYGGNINRGDGDFIFNNKFLMGDRTNNTIFTFDIIFEPVKQYFLEFSYQNLQKNIIYLSKKEKNSYFRVFFKVLL